MTLPYPTFGGPPEDYAPRDPPQTCSGKPQPGVELFADFVVSNLGGVKGGIFRPCTDGGSSHHHEGRAWDWMVDWYNPVDRASAEVLLSWLMAPDEHGEPHAMLRRAGIDYVIWGKRIWNARDRVWSPYDGFDAAGDCTATGGCRDPHTNHVHLSFGWPGARAETSFYDWLQHGPDDIDPRTPIPEPYPFATPDAPPSGAPAGKLAVWALSAVAAYLAARAAQRSSMGFGKARATRAS
jgi:hypothetical protein